MYRGACLKAQGMMNGWQRSVHQSTAALAMCQVLETRAKIMSVYFILHVQFCFHLPFKHLSSNLYYT